MFERLMFWRKKPPPLPRLMFWQKEPPPIPAPPRCPKCKRELGDSFSTYGSGLRLCVPCARKRNA